jgi:hypothetical protein
MSAYQLRAALTTRIGSVPIWAWIFLSAVGVPLGIAALRAGKKHDGWIQLRTDKRGTVINIVVRPQFIPKAVRARLPESQGKGLCTEDRVNRLAENYGLYTAWRVNPHLRYSSGDTTYWAKQKRPAHELEMEFLARRCVLEAAERVQARIPNQGDLSHWSGKVYAVLMKKAQEK